MKFLSGFLAADFTNKRALVFNMLFNFYCQKDPPFDKVTTCRESSKMCPNTSRFYGKVAKLQKLLSILESGKDIQSCCLFWDNSEKRFKFLCCVDWAQK
jgi:hypothetical protein